MVGVIGKLLATSTEEDALTGRRENVRFPPIADIGAEARVHFMEASHRHWTVQPRYGPLRRILFPFYGWDQLIFFAVFAIVAALLFAIFDLKLALYIVVGGYVGAMLAMQISTPSTLLLPIEYEKQVVQLLDRARFLERTGSGHEWINARGRMYRWDTDTIRLELTQGGLLVTGRYYDLNAIAQEVGT